MSYPNYDHHRALTDIRNERTRQITKWGVQHRADDTGGTTFEDGAAGAKQACQAAEAAGGAPWRLVLVEEIYEALAETEPAALRAELVQVAAVAVAWIEDIDSRTLSRPLTAGEAIIALVPGAEGAGIKP